MALLNINAMRAQMETIFLVDTATVQTKSYTSDAGGGATAVFNTVGTVKCKVNPLRDNPTETAGRINPEADWLVTVPANTTVTTEGRILVGSRTFEVLRVRAPKTWELTRQVECREVL